MIKVADKNDFETVKSFVPSLIRDSKYGTLFKNYTLTDVMFDQYINTPTEKLCLIVIDEKQPVGFAMFDILAWPYIDHEVKLARISFIYIEPEFRKKGHMDDVLTAFEHWGKLVGAHYYSVGVKTPKRGYQKVETVYMKEIA